MDDLEFKKKLLVDLFNDTRTLTIVKVLDPSALAELFDCLIRKGWRKVEEK